MKQENSAMFLELKDISKRYPVYRFFPFRVVFTDALQNADLELKKNSVTCILGPNGAGKTTMLKIMAGLVLPDSGEICHGDNKTPVAGFVTPNERSFYWRLSGRENLNFFASLHRLHGKERLKAVDRVINETGLAEYASVPYRLYSSGIKQRLNIARALLSNPSLILLDEPTAHLDPLARADFWDFITHQIIGERNSTVLLATHDLEEATRLSDQMAILHRGRIVARGTIRDLQKSMEKERCYSLSVRRQDEPASWKSYVNRSMLETLENDILQIRTHDEELIRKMLGDTVAEGIIPVSFSHEEASLLSIIRHFTGDET